MFEKRMLATWGDMDFNGHMRNTAFLDKSADIRLMFFAEHGLPIAQFVRLGIGPVVRKDDIDYFREIRLLEELRVTLATAGLSEDGARFVMRNEFWRSDNSLAARVTSSGGWLDHRARKLVVPPDALQAALREVPRTDDFQGERRRTLGLTGFQASSPASRRLSDGPDLTEPGHRTLSRQELPSQGPAGAREAIKR